MDEMAETIQTTVIEQFGINFFGSCLAGKLTSILDRRAGSSVIGWILARSWYALAYSEYLTSQWGHYADRCRKNYEIIIFSPLLFNNSPSAGASRLRQLDYLIPTSWNKIKNKVIPYPTFFPEFCSSGHGNQP